MKTTTFATLKTISFILLAMYMALLLFTALHAAPPLLASVGWHGRIVG